MERDPKRLVILKRLCDYLSAEIVEGAVYQHTLKDSVFRGRYKFDDDDPLPALSFLENLDPDRYPRQAGIGGGELPTQAQDWVLLLQGWAIDDKCNPLDPAYRLMADTQIAMAKIVFNKQRVDPFGATEPPNQGRELLGDLIAGMTMEPGVVRPPVEDLSARAFFYMRVHIKLVEDPNDPYNLQ